LVDKDYRNNGYGKNLMNRYVEWFNSLELYASAVYVGDIEMIKFYKKYGYKICNVKQSTEILFRMIYVNLEQYVPESS
jgi:GNAT superfamily N-acetyltransferase